MDTRFVMYFDFRNKSDDIQFSEIIEHFNFIICQIDGFTQTKKTWYETGYSRKQALSQTAFQAGNITDNTLLKWERRYKKTNHYLLTVYGMLMMMTIVTEFHIGKCFMMKEIESQ